MKRQSTRFTALNDLFLSVYDTWALSKVPSGVLHGVKRSLGLFTECINFHHQTNSSSIGALQGKYCLVSYTTSKEVIEGSGDMDFNWLEG
jgi:Nose resistant-to-fluoxetine protein, N-terminal domain